MHQNAKVTWCPLKSSHQPYRAVPELTRGIRRQKYNHPQRPAAWNQANKKISLNTDSRGYTTHKHRTSDDPGGMVRKNKIYLCFPTCRPNDDRNHRTQRGRQPTTVRDAKGQGFAPPSWFPPHRKNFDSFLCINIISFDNGSRGVIIPVNACLHGGWGSGF